MYKTMNCLKILITNRYLMIEPKYCHQFIQKRHSNTAKQSINKDNNSFEDNTKSDLNLDSIVLDDKRRGDCLIYSGPQNMIKMIKTIKTFSISTTLIAAGVQPFIFQQILATNSSAFAIGFASMTSAGIVLSPLVLNWFTKRYVTQLYYNYETQVFTAWVLNLLNRRSCVQYKASEVLVPEALGMFTTYTVGLKKKRPFFVDPEFVTDFNAYKLMLGYDKPLDIKLEHKLIEQQNQNKTKQRNSL